MRCGQESEEDKESTKKTVIQLRSIEHLRKRTPTEKKEDSKESYEAGTDQEKEKNGRDQRGTRDSARDLEI